MWQLIWQEKSLKKTITQMLRVDLNLEEYQINLEVLGTKLSQIHLL
jgi:hypothetical protein